MSLPFEDTTTNDRGEFRLVEPSELVRFSKEGYRPATLRARALTSDVVLIPSMEKHWTPPLCSKSGETRFGDRMQFAVPRGARLRRDTDVDYHTIAIRRGKTWLVFGTGVHWGFPLPRPQTLAAMLSVRERDIETPWGTKVAEYRGHRQNGSRWRTITMFGESIEYDNANEAEASYFDAILDTLCFASR